MKMTRESLRAKKKMHRNTTVMFSRPLGVRLIDVVDGVATVTFEYKTSDSYGSKFKLELTAADVAKLNVALAG